jgi:tricorn protease
MTGVDNFDLSDDGKVVVVKQGPGFIRMDAGTTEAPTGTGDEDPHIKLEGWSMRHEPRQEWKQMVLEAWRIQRDFFYDPNMHGVDWPAILKLYEPLIDRISTRDELNDLIGEMIGEMNAGHAYIFGGDIPQPKQISVGLLGADISRDPKSRYFRIDKIFIPDRTNKDLTSPLALPEVNAKTGEYIIAIDGIPTNTVSNYLELLQDKAGKEVILTLNSTPQMEGSRDAIVKTISWEGELRYRDWVENRRKYVEKASGGRIGYVHLSDMSTDGLCEFGRMYYPQYQKEGMVIDVRYNGGGYIAPMLLSQLDRRVWCTEKGRRGAVDRRPYSAFYGHFAILCNEETGSDGETFTQGAKMLNLGRVFGKRTWGGWVGIRGDKFLNDRAWYTSPEFSGWGVIGAEKGKWLIEGPGVSPDETVENDPESVLAGKDPQLDTAIAYLLDKIKNEPRRLPEVPPIPYKEVNVPRR